MPDTARTTPAARLSAQDALSAFDGGSRRAFNRVDDLRTFAAEQEIDIPANVVHRAAIVSHISDALNQRVVDEAGVVHRGPTPVVAPVVAPATTPTPAPAPRQGIGGGLAAALAIMGVLLLIALLGVAYLLGGMGHLGPSDVTIGDITAEGGEGGSANATATAEASATVNSCIKLEDCDDDCDDGRPSATRRGSSGTTSGGTQRSTGAVTVDVDQDQTVIVIDDDKPEPPPPAAKPTENPLGDQQSNVDNPVHITPVTDVAESPSDYVAENVEEAAASGIIDVSSQQ